MDSIFQFFNQNEMIKDGTVAVGVFLLLLIVRMLIPKIERVITQQITKRTKSDLDDQILKTLSRSIRKIIWLAGFYIIFHVWDSIIPEKFLAIADHALYVLAVFIFASLVGGVLRLLLDWYTDRWGSRVHGRLNDEFSPLFRKLITIIVYTVSIIMILDHFNQSVSSIIVSLGVGSLAVALAAKDTLANMIAGFMIMTDRPFRIGDRIQLESGEKGDVQDIGLRTTKILTFDNTLIVVPNHQIINEKVTNLSYPDPQIRVRINVGVAYGSDLDRVKEILVSVCNSHPKVLDTPPAQAYFTNFGDSSLDFLVVCRVSQWRDEWTVAEELRMEINRAFKKEGIEIPFPQRVVEMKNPEMKKNQPQK